MIVNAYVIGRKVQEMHGFLTQEQMLSQSCHLLMKKISMWIRFFSLIPIGIILLAWMFCVKKTRNPKVHVHQLELFDGCEPIEEGFDCSVDSLSLQAKHTHGHSVGGITYMIDGLAKPVAVVGDAMFAGSMGGE